MFSGHPILDEIKQGFKLRPTKAKMVDKSRPIFLAEGEDAETSLAPTRRAPAGVPPAPTTYTPSPRQASPAPPLPSSMPPPPPLGHSGPPPPPPPMGQFAPPPPPPMNINRSKSPALLKLGGAAPAEVDRGQLLKSIQGGLRLRKTVTNDKSGLVVDDELREQSVKLVAPVDPPPELFVPRSEARTPSPSQNRLSPRGRTHLQVESDDEHDRFLTPDGLESDYGTPEPEERSWRTKTPEPKPKVDYVFEEKNLRVTSEDLKQEIPSGSAAAKIAKFMNNGNGSGITGGGTLPRAAFRPSPVRSTFQKEVNNNASNGADSDKPKAASKWATVETGGLKRPSRGNVPFEKDNMRAGSELPPQMRERSASALEEPTVDRARTQSPSDQRATSTLPTPISVRTDFPPPVQKSTLPLLPAFTASQRQPEIQETPPTPMEKSPASSTYSQKAPASSTYSYSRNSNSCGNINGNMNSNNGNNNAHSGNSSHRSTSPSEAALPSPVSSMSSASLPSPSSLSPGSNSPETAPRRRINPGFDKAKEKFSGGAVSSASPTLPAPRPFFMKNTSLLGGQGGQHSNSASPTNSPRGSIGGKKDEIEAVKKAVKEAANRQKRVINVPISAPWHNPRDTSEPARRARDREPYSFSSIHPDDFRRNYRFNIDLSNEAPLSIINR